MKNFVCASMGAVLASAKTREYVKGIGANGTEGKFVRLSDAVKKNVIQAGTNQ